MVLFGSSATQSVDAETSEWSDFDLHVVAGDPRALESVAWEKELPYDGFRHRIARPATGGVRKVTVVYTDAQFDLVVVPAVSLWMGDLALQVGLHRDLRSLRVALNEMATCLHTGYRFLKGADRWDATYERIAKLNGVRLSDQEIAGMAEVFLCDLLWVLQKLARGERVAAQHALHTKLVDVNLRLWRELRLRRKQPLPSFGLGRRIETLASEEEREWLAVSARATTEELAFAAWKTYDGLRALMRQIVPTWTEPAAMANLLGTTRSRLSGK